MQDTTTTSTGASPATTPPAFEGASGGGIGRDNSPGCRAHVNACQPFYHLDGGVYLTPQERRPAGTVGVLYSPMINGLYFE